MNKSVEQFCKDMGYTETVTRHTCNMERVLEEYADWKERVLATEIQKLELENSIKQLKSLIGEIQSRVDEMDIMVDKED